MANAQEQHAAREMPGRAPGPRKNVLAIASICVLVFGLFTFWGAVGFGVIAAILGHIALGQIKRNPGRYRNRDLALTSVILGWTMFGATLVVITMPGEIASIVGPVLGD
ncbi:DUF4190 domain-containing protein [Saccharopolyspora indica]|uniref:DUF4190 domain-containing protein n=1 Tax=Saccharopolyspora indica TaxID=1229659 RepID=UPI0022EB63E4|nr:DUF4190 domain-containing protein [Saccharopolyspora indica]MDA3643204.1 DUF4190 domain-containing protein [Saccharopolyspora indica]